MTDLLFLTNAPEPYIDLFEQSYKNNPIIFFDDFVKKDGINIIYEKWNPANKSKIDGGSLDIHLKSKYVKIKSYYDEYEHKDVLIEYNFDDLKNEIITKEVQNSKQLIEDILKNDFNISNEAGGYIRKVNRNIDELITHIKGIEKYSFLVSKLIEIKNYSKNVYSKTFRNNTVKRTTSFIINPKFDNSDFLEDFKDLLVNKRFIGNCKLNMLKQIFLDKKIEQRIIWIGTKKDLFFLIKILVELHIIEDPKNDIWNKTVECFIHKNGSEFSNNDFNKYSYADIRMPKYKNLLAEIKKI